MATMVVEMDLEEYRIVSAEGEIGQETTYGDVAVLRVGDAVYYALVEDENAADAKVYRVDTVTEVPCTVEDVDFSGAVEEGAEETDVESDVVEDVASDAADQPGGDEEDEDEDDEDDEDGDEDEDDDDEEGEDGEA